MRELLGTHRIDTVVHFAAESHVDRSILGPGRFHPHQCGRHACAAEGREGARGSSARPCPRTASITCPPTRCTARWARTMRRSTSRRPMRRIRRIRPARRARITWCAPITRPTGSTPRSPTARTTTGPYQFPEKLIPLTLINILRGKPLPVYGDGLQVRDWLHVADHCEAIALALDARPAGRGLQHRRQQRDHQYRHRAHAVRAGRRVFWRAAPELAAAYPGLARRAGGKPAIELIKHVRDRPGHDRRYAIDYRKAAARARLRADARSGARPARDAGMVSGAIEAGGRRCSAARLCGLGGEELRATIGSAHDAGQLDLCGAEDMMWDRGEKMVFSGMSARSVNGFTAKIKSSGSHHGE